MSPKPNPDPPPNQWAEENSQQFLDYGRYFVPDRELQLRLISDLLKGLPEHSTILELACGEGLLAEAILEKLPHAAYIGLDGSALMLGKAAQRLQRFGERVRLDKFELADRSWRKLETPVQAVISSLAIHHLVGEQKKVLYRDIYTLLSEQGRLVVADIIEPATPTGRQLAGEAWDEAVHQRSLDLDGNTKAFEFFSNEHWNTYLYPDPDDIDHPSGLFEQLQWLEQAGFNGVDVHYFRAGHAIFSGWKGKLE